MKFNRKRLSFLIVFIVIALLKVHSQSNPKAEIIGDLNVEGTVTQLNPPTDSNHLVTKEYMDKMMMGFGIQMGSEGFDDWYLPSLDEIVLVFITKPEFISFDGSWTSSEIDARYAYTFSS